jgi:hypothetical protein
MLRASGNVDLSQHVNHQMELTGTWVAMPGRATTPAATPGAAAGSSDTPGNSGNAGEGRMGGMSGMGGVGAPAARTFLVTSVRMVAATCN